MYKNRYFYNPDTLRFERHQRTLYQKFRRIFIYLLIIVLVAVFLRISFDYYHPSPKLSYYRQKSEILRTAYNVLQSKIAKSELLLTEIQKRDDGVYRSVFDLEPLPGSVRDAGFGGSSELMSGLLNSEGLRMVNNADNKLEILSTKVLVQEWSLKDLYDRAKFHQQLILSKPYIHPICPADSFWLTSSFGYRRDPFSGRRRMHGGIDIAGPVGLKIYATGDGIVINAENSKYGYGKEVIIDHGFGYITRYAHLHNILVEPGQRVKRGTNIGNLGNSGRSTGPHLHYEVIYQGRCQNPFYFFYENLTPEEYTEIINLASN